MDLWAVILYPLWTTGLVFLDDPLTTNLSWIGNGFGKRTAVILWAVAGAVLFRKLIHTLADIVHCPLKKGEDFIYVLMILSLLVPYLPDRYPWFSQLHILLSNISFILLSVDMLYVLYQGALRGRKCCRNGILAISGILMICSMIYITFLSINSVLELFYTVSTSWTLIIMICHTEKAGE